MQPSPIIVGHFVGAGEKYFLMRLLGWWHGAVDTVPVAASAGGELSQRRVFPPGVRLLALRRHSLRLDPQNARDVFSLMAQFIYLAFLLGRRAVLPAVPCELAAARQPPSSLFDVAPLANQRMCSAHEVEWLPEVSVPPSWSLAAVASRRLAVSSSMATRDKSLACCQLVPREPCVDGSGTHRHLHEELIFHERDHAQLQSELPTSATRYARTTFAELFVNGSIPTDPAPITPVLVLDATNAHSLEGLPSHAHLARWLRTSRPFKLLSSELPHAHSCIREMRSRIKSKR